MPEEEASKGNEEEGLKDGEEAEPEEETKDPEELLSRLKYLQAEFENYKKRAAKEMQTFLEHSNQRIISCILPVIDDLERASTSIKNEEDANGVKMIFDNLMETLRNEGLEEMGSVGEDFDPFKHEAVAQVQDDDLKSDQIAEVVQKGYSFKSKVIRPSKVVVVKNKPKEGNNGEDNRD
ncbi:MAG: nucleotide exchange factor GrpE [Methanobacteriota archaeon]|nr:MAG: nucleotide exchange factor GrpE [Euryarchaeota archaeon]